jgi:hypothetical protein
MIRTQTKPIRPIRCKPTLQELNKLTIQFQKSGGSYKARWAGRSEFVFGETKEAAEKRLRSRG